MRDALEVLHGTPRFKMCVISACFSKMRENDFLEPHRGPPLDLLLAQGFGPGHPTRWTAPIESFESFGSKRTTKRASKV